MFMVQLMQEWALVYFSFRDEFEKKKKKKGNFKTFTMSVSQLMPMLLKKAFPENYSSETKQEIISSRKI